MDLNYEKKYHELERTHFWFRERRDAIKEILGSYKISEDAKILDIGCSSGILLEELQEMGFKSENLYGIDISKKAIENCRSNNLDNTYEMNAADIRLKTKFDIVIASDCLEHLEHDEKALESWKNLLKDNGIIIVFVPAFMFLWTNHDVVNHHFRRYTKLELVTKVKRTGLKVIQGGYWNALLFIPVAIMRIFRTFLMKSKKIDPSHSDLKKVRFNGFFSCILRAENSLLKYISFPFGISTFCVAKKH